MGTQSTQVSRRSMLGALAVVPVAALPDMPAAAMPDTTRWDRAVAAYEAANEKADSFYLSVLAPLEPQEPRCAAYNYYRVGTSNIGAPVMHRFTRAELLDTKGVYARTKGWQEARAELKAYEAAFAEFDARTDYTRVNERMDRLDVAVGAALRALLVTPAPNAAALCRKLTMMTDSEGEFLYDTGPVVLALRADAERLGA